MATLTKVNPKVYQGPVMSTIKLLITNGSSWKAGQFLTVSSGALVACATDAVDIKYLALADQADPGNATTYAEVGVIDPAHVFVMNLYSGAPSSATIGANIALNVASNVCTADYTDTTHDSLNVVDVLATQTPLTDSASDTYGRILVKVLGTVIQAG